jgi:hypothetical protein
MRKDSESNDDSANSPGGRTGSERLDRRALLRRAGGVAALAGGAAVVQAAAGGSAQAAAGDPAVLGANTAGTATTSITSASTADATLNLANTGAAHAPLSLSPSSTGYQGLGSKSPGELWVDDNHDLFYVDEALTGGAFVYTESTANQVVGIVPQRMLDTRYAANRTNVINPAVLDSTGRLIGGKWLNLDLLSLATFFESAFVNLTAVAPTLGGYLALAPDVPASGKPATSNLNYNKGVNIANSAVAATSDGTIWIYALTTTHVILDVNALNLPSADPSVLLVPPAGGAVSAARRQAAFAARRQARVTRT